MIGADWLAALPVVAGEPSPQAIEYDHGASLGPGSVNVTESLTESPGCARRSWPALTSGITGPVAGLRWQVPFPVSRLVPEAAMNCHAYEPSASVSLSTPYTPVRFTSLFGMMSVLVPSRPSPPVPTMISRIPFTGSATPADVCGANRS